MQSSNSGTGTAVGACPDKNNTGNIREAVRRRKKQLLVQGSRYTKKWSGMTSWLPIIYVAAVEESLKGCSFEPTLIGDEGNVYPISGLEKSSF